jgi:hypothetical protein
MPSLTIHGQTVRLPRPLRQYAVVNVRAAAHETTEGTYVAYAQLVGQSDSLTAARAKQASAEPGPAATTLLLDTATVRLSDWPVSDPAPTRHEGIENVEWLARFYAAAGQTEAVALILDAALTADVGDDRRGLRAGVVVALEAVLDADAPPASRVLDLATGQNLSLSDFGQV